MYQVSPKQGVGKQLRARTSDTFAMPRTILCLPLVVLAACSPHTDLAAERGTPVTAPDAGSASQTSTASAVGLPELVDPPLNARLVPPNLAKVVLRFLGPLQVPVTSAPLKLRGSDGSEVDMALGPAIVCSGLGACYTAVPASCLAPTTLYTIEVNPEGLRMESGKPVPAGEVGGFTTAEAVDEYAPLITSVEMTLVEGCVFARFVTDEAAWPELVITAGDQVMVMGLGDIASRFDAATRLINVPTGVDGTANVRATDRAGHSADSAGMLVHLPPKLPRLVITEILGNPAGTEGTQEFVELQNLDPEPVSLAGMVIEDKTGNDVLPAVTVPAGGFAVVVAEAFVVNEGKDPPPRESAVLVRVSGKIGSDGFANAGEPVRLVKDGIVISQYGGWVSTSATSWNGRSVHRVSVDSCDQPGAWTTTPQTPTPGW
jgi:hypothetical protein